MSEIDPSARVHPSAEICPNVQIGPFCYVGPKVYLAEGTILHPDVKILENTRIGRNCQIYSGAVIGGPPQDHKYKGEESWLEIGDNNILREYTTLHRATGEGQVTRVGDNNMIMAYAHIGHNCVIGNHVTIASYVGISGHVVVEDHANFGGITGVHQFCRVGTYAMIGGMSGVGQNIPPFMLANGRPARVYDINRIGLRRAGISPKVRSELHMAYKLLYRSNLNMAQALEAIEQEIEKSQELEHLLQFIRMSRNGKDFRGGEIEPL